MPPITACGARKAHIGAFGIVAALSLAGCGDEEMPRIAQDVTQCLRREDASLVTGRQAVRDQEEQFDLELTPDTKVVARGELSTGDAITLFVSPKSASDRAETRALEFVRLFGYGRDHVVRRGTVLLLFWPDDAPASVSRGEYDLADMCLGDAVTPTR